MQQDKISYKEVKEMQEEVGVCCKCGKKVYCLDGFLNGTIELEGLLCFDCSNLKLESHGNVE
jgi:hypothetical protein